jgi:hypothetical protein
VRRRSGLAAAFSIRIRGVRNVFFALVFVNFAYFAWAHWIDAPKPAPVNEAMAKLPQLKMIDEVPPEQRPKAGAAKPTPSPTAACLSVGPFGDVDNSARAAAILKDKGFDPRQRAEPGTATEGFWVYVSGMKSQAEADRALVTLEHNGIKDALVMPETTDAGRRLSLGLYSEKSRADRRAAAVRLTGLDAQVAERKLPGTLYWVDLNPPPGATSVPIQDLFAEGVSSRIAVQPCPSAQPATPAPAQSASVVAAAALHPIPSPPVSAPVPVSANTK